MTIGLTSSRKNFFPDGAEAMTGVTNTGLSSEVVDILDVLKTPDGLVIADAKATTRGKNLTIVIEFDEDVATESSAKLSVDVKTKSSASASSCDKVLLTAGPYSDVAGQKIFIKLPEEGVCGSVQLVIKTGGSSETFTAGNITSALLVPFL